MKKKTRRKLAASAGLLAAFVLWTVIVRNADVQPIGPMGSKVGLAALNGWFHRLTGVRLSLYTVTDWLSLIPLGAALGFAGIGLSQWIRRKNLFRVDRSLLVLGGFYAAVLAAYLFFERFVVNYRPVLINGVLEASYPSSTTMLVMCVMPTAIMEFNTRIKNNVCRRCVHILLIAFIAFMVIGRLISGVHWFSDIIGGMLLSGGLVLLYYSIQMACDK